MEPAGASEISELIYI